MVFDTNHKATEFYIDSTGWYSTLRSIYLINSQDSFLNSASSSIFYMYTVITGL